MMRFILAAALALGVSSFAKAGELDNEAGVTNKELKGTLVLRVDTRTNEMAFVKLDNALGSEVEAKALAQNNANFAPVPAANVRSELDKDGAASSWYFYNPYPYPYYTPAYGYGPSCNYYGNYYQPYYSYNCGYYNYYYYGSCWSYCR